MRPLSIFVLVILLTGCDMIRDQLDGNQPPVIETFEADPAEGEAPLLVAFSWTVLDIEGASLSCTLDFGDGQSTELKNCGQVANQFHEYGSSGGYVAVLTTSDEHHSVSRSVPVTVVPSAGD